MNHRQLSGDHLDTEEKEITAGAANTPRATNGFQLSSCGTASPVTRGRPKPKGGTGVKKRLAP